MIKAGDASKSSKLLERARKLIPGGVNSPVRAFRAVGGDPFFVVSARGSHLTDADGRDLLDFVCSWGPLVLGHAHPAVVEAVQRAAERGTSYGTPTPDEVELADLVCRTVPSIEQVRFVSSGTEATMTALRLARGATGRDVFVKFEGGYHGHGDSFLVAAGSGVATLGIPGSPGVPDAVAGLTATVPYNDLDAVAGLFKRHGDSIAAVFVEPVAGNMGVVPPRPGFLEGLRSLCTEHGALLVFDEVITGFRVAPGGAQELYGVMPDLTTLGKILGGGLPVGAVGGPRRLMSKLAPEGPIYQAGTLSGNPLAMAAGRAMLETLLSMPAVYDTLEAKGRKLADGMISAAAAASVPATVCRVGSMMTMFLTPDPVWSFADAKKADTGLYRKVFHELLERGVYVAPSAFEAMFVSTAHGDDDLDQACRAWKDALIAAKASKA
jgi:glutamate-1-semialdehyde 2,1-aminomutase